MKKKNVLEGLFSFNQNKISEKLSVAISKINVGKILTGMLPFF